MIIEIDGLKKSYRGFTLDISMSVPEGRVSGLVGRNGAGKSTTIKAILGLVRPDGGSVKVFGAEAHEMGPACKARIGVALSDSWFSQELRIPDVASVLYSMYPDFDMRFFITKCEQSGLPYEKPVKEYSTGMKARLRVITALSRSADLLIMDEPTAGLDVVARNEVLDMIRDYLRKNENCSVLVSSHISSDLEGLCDDIYLINNGRLVLHEDTDRLLGRYGVMKVDSETFEKLDKQHILGSKEESFGYSCFTDEKKFYTENYPGIVMENGSIDDLIVIMGGAEK